MAYAVKTNAAAAKAASERTSEYLPLPPGTYQATVQEYEVRPASAPTGAHADLDVLNTKFRIADDSPVGAGRTFYGSVPLFHAWNPNGNPKFPDGSPAYDHFAFFGDAIGVPEEALLEGIIPEFDSLLGKRVGIKLKTKNHYSKKDAAGQPLKESVIDGFSAPKAGGSAGPSAAVAAAAGDPWATAAPAAAAPQPGADVWGAPAAAAAAPPVDAWGTPAAAPVAAAVPVAVAVAGDPQADAPWSVAAEDVAYASVAAQRTPVGVGF